METARQPRRAASRDHPIEMDAPVTSERPELGEGRMACSTTLLTPILAAMSDPVTRANAATDRRYGRLAALAFACIAFLGCDSSTSFTSFRFVDYELTSGTFNGNPLFFGADPSGHVWADGKMWIYPTTDHEDWSQLDHWNAWSSEDLRTWTLHERIFSADQCDWCVNNAWAPDIAYRNGKYYLYYYFLNDGDQPRGVGVAVADQPSGPFVNVSVDGPLVDGHDPSVLIDDEGQAYLYVGHVIYFLTEDMTHIQKENGRNKVQIVEFTGGQPLGGWEAPWVFERAGKYYYTLADDDYRQLRYYIGDSPIGPFDYAGTLLHKVSGLNIHHSIVQYGDRWILWYHVWPVTGLGQRRVQGEFLTFEEDGTIRPVSVTTEGVG